MSWHSRLIIQLYILKSRLSLKMRRHKIFLLLMSVMTNALKKDTTAGKSVKSGRFPLRLSLIFTNLDSLAGLQSVVMVVRVRHLWNKTTREVQFYLTSLHSDAQLIGRAIRKHWGIENQAHWILDCTFAEDSCRIRSFHSPSNLALLRRLALRGCFKSSERSKIMPIVSP